MVPEAGVAVLEENLKQLLLADPEVVVMVAVTEELVLNTNPVGAFKMNVPEELVKSWFDASVTVGPVSVVYEPLVVSALIALPPVAVVTDTLAKASAGTSIATSTAKVIAKRADMFFRV